MSENFQILNHLSSETIRLLSSSQIITSVSSTVKELFENALDAGSSSIQIKLENFGLNLIEVKDDGCGISGENVHKIFLPGYTSKISQFSDLDNLETYGFRGQALSALCSLAEIALTTKTDKDVLAMTYNINKNGLPASSAPSHLPKGTIISVTNLFKALPVRKQFASSKRKMEEELKKVENVVKALAVVNNQLRVVLIHNKNTIWQKNSVNGIKQSFMQVIGLRFVSKMELLTEKLNNISLELIVPKKDINDAQLLYFSFPQNFLFVNKRPIICKEITKIIEEITNNFFKISDKHVMYLASFIIPSCDVDVNLEPNKTKALLKNQSDVLRLLTECLQSYYGQLLTKPLTEECLEIENSPKRAKFDESFMIHEKPSSVCSNINKNNCVLASEKEITDFNQKLNSQQMSATNFTVHREDIQSNISTQEVFNRTLIAIEASKKRPELSVIDWSRGNVNLEDGKTLPAGAGVIFQSEKILQQPETDKATRIAKDVADFDLSLPSVSSQMGKKELTGFTKFARIIRPKIIAEHPNMPFTRVPVILAERWKALSTDEREYYESVAKAVDEKRKTHEKQKTKLKITPPKPPSRPERRQILFQISMKDIIKPMKTLSKNETCRLIGQLDPNGEWIYANNSEIGLLRNDALDQLVLYQKMIASYKLPSKELTHRIHLSENNFDKNCLDLVKNLETGYDPQKCADIVINPIIEKNGFRIEIVKPRQEIFLTGIPAVVDCSVPELIETLRLYQKFGEYACLSDLRPETIKNYIMNEAKRIILEKPQKPNRGETAALLKTWRECLSHLPAKDLNDRNIFVPFYQLT